MTVYLVCCSADSLVAVGVLVTEGILLQFKLLLYALGVVFWQGFFGSKGDWNYSMRLQLLS